MGHHPVEDSNRSDNNSICAVLDQRLSRRQILRGSATAATMVAGASLVACGGDSDSDSTGGAGGNNGPTIAPEALGFSAVPHSLEDRVVVPDGYQASVLIAKGDPLSLGLAAFKNDGTDVDYDQRSGDEHDAMAYFGLSDSGMPAASSSSRGILCINHENLEDATLHQNGPTAAASNGGARPKTEVDREIQAHGVACVEVIKEGNQWRYVQGSPFNRRITAATELTMTGPVAGSELVKTRLSPAGMTRFGTLNNCGHGETPWHTYISGEENWFSYFRRDDDSAMRTSADNTLLARYGLTPGGQGFSYREWDTVAAGDLYARFNITVSGASATDDFRNEANQHGFAIEVDPYRPTEKAKVRTVFGRFAHEGVWFAPAVAGKPVVAYMGDDARNEYIYKFVSAENWDEADENLGLSAGDKYLTEGTLYVASFNADGAGEWKALKFGQNGLDASNPIYPFASEADVLVGARLAADHAGATKMDRPEWSAINPLNGEIYIALTNNRTSNRPVDDLDSANPRAYEDVVGGANGSDGNANGHIIRWRETGGQHDALTFDWDIFLFGAESGADSASVNLSGLTADNDFSSPDGIFIDMRGLMWIQTDDGTYTDTVNNQMLVAIPGEVGDGGMQQVTSSVGADEKTVTTFVGKSASEVDLRRFLVGVPGCEITGIALTPDAKSMFVNIQHPGEGGSAASFNVDKSSWPNSNGNAQALGDGSSRPRSATIVITREDGGEIAL